MARTLGYAPMGAGRIVQKALLAALVLATTTTATSSFATSSSSLSSASSSGAAETFTASDVSEDASTGTTAITEAYTKPISRIMKRDGISDWLNQIKQEMKDHTGPFTRTPLPDPFTPPHPYQGPPAGKVSDSISKRDQVSEWVSQSITAFENGTPPPPDLPFTYKSPNIKISKRDEASEAADWVHESIEAFENGTPPPPDLPFTYKSPNMKISKRDEASEAADWVHESIEAFENGTPPPPDLPFRYVGPTRPSKRDMVSDWVHESIEAFENGTPPPPDLPFTYKSPNTRISKRGRYMGARAI